MERQVINITPVLGKQQHADFLDFCRHVKQGIKKLSVEGRMQFLIQQRGVINDDLNGSKFHDNTDLLFLQNLLLDLIAQDWDIVITKSGVRLELETLDEEDKNIEVEKAKTRRRHLLARDSQLKIPSVSDFIKSIEKRRLTANGWHSIFSVMRDGNKLSELLQETSKLSSAEEKIKKLNDQVKPYIQFAEPEKRCEHTGLLLSDIWRYFRHTWISEYKSLPGRSVSILIRDAAAPNHPVIGIAALGSSVAQQTCRDEWLGWEGGVFLERLRSNPSSKHGKWILNTVDRLLGEIYLKDFIKDQLITRSDLKKPTTEIVKYLREQGVYFRSKHVDNPHSSKFSSSKNNQPTWEQRAQSNLFKSKRAILLADLLSIKYVLNKYNFTGSKKQLIECLRKNDFSEVVERLVRKVKSNQVGINIMDIIICGAVPPYNHILGGKLVCMLLTSPEVVQYYNEKYSKSVSLIASSMSGKPVVRVPQLVFLGTTSLYGIGSSQYNRISIPTSEIGGDATSKIEYKKLGYTEGYGSFHFSGITIKLAGFVVGRESGRARVNSIFGEGANPLLRKIKDAIEILKLESNPILNHRNRRVVYGVSLAENITDVLMGLADKPKYFIPLTKVKTRTELLAKYWIKRWLVNRISNPEVLEQVASHSIAYPITHGARVPSVVDQNVLTLFDINQY
jgi:hypothetical protein